MNVEFRDNTVKCSSCNQWFNKLLVTSNNDLMCPKCIKEYRRKRRAERKRLAKVKDSDEYKYCESFGSAGIYF